jgi:hypothetical protein
MTKRKVFSLLKKIAIAFILTLFLSLLALIPRVGYHGKTSFLYFDEKYVEGWIPYRIVTLRSDITLNPIVYPFSWLLKDGYISGKFQMIYHPQSYGSESDLPPYYPGGHPFWGSHEDMEQEGLMALLLPRLFSNALFLYIIIFVILISGKHELLLCLLFGIVGFVLGGIFGALIGLVIGGALAITIHYVEIWDWFQEKLYPKESSLGS